MESAPRTIMTDPARLKQILLNIVGNAVKFSKPGTKARVRVWSEPVPVSGDNSPDKPFARIWVADEGIGIPKHSQHRVFGMFQRAAKGYEGFLIK